MAMTPTGACGWGRNYHVSRRWGVIPGPLYQDVLDHVPVHVGEAEIAALEAVGEMLMLDPEQLHDGRLEIMHMDGLIDCVEAQFI